MPTELFWLTLTALMTALFWVPYVIDRIVVRGLVPTLMDGQPVDPQKQSKWAQRAMAAHRNAVENLVVFAALVLTASVLHLSNPIVGTAAAVYFFARLAHFVIYTAGIPIARTLAFVVGCAAQITIACAILHWV